MAVTPQEDSGTATAYTSTSAMTMTTRDHMGLFTWILNGTFQALLK